LLCWLPSLLQIMHYQLEMWSKLSFIPVSIRNIFLKTCCAPSLACVSEPGRTVCRSGYLSCLMTHPYTAFLPNRNSMFFLTNCVLHGIGWFIPVLDKLHSWCIPKKKCVHESRRHQAQLVI